MGIFDKYQDTVRVNWQPAEPLEAWIATLFAVTNVDGERSEVESDAFTAMLVKKQAFIGYPIGSRFQPIVNAALEIGWKELGLRAARGVSPEHAPTVFAMACELAMVDGNLAGAEKEHLEKLVTELKLDPALAERIIEVFLIRMKDERMITD